MTSSKKKTSSKYAPLEDERINAYVIPNIKANKLKFLLYVLVPEGFILQEKAINITESDEITHKREIKNKLFNELKGSKLYAEEKPQHGLSKEERKAIVKERDQIIREYEGEFYELSQESCSGIHLEFNVFPWEDAPQSVYYCDCDLCCGIENFSFEIRWGIKTEPEKKKFVDPILISYP